MVNNHAGRFEPGWNELMLAMGAQQRFLHQVVGTVAITRKRDRERAQAGYRR